MIEFRGITKTFKGKLALSPFDLRIEKGEIFGLLGHNGAGKSTTLGMLLGHVRPDAGDVLLDGISVQTHRLQALRKVGAIFETPCFYDYLTGLQNLRYFVSLSGQVSKSELTHVIDLVGLHGRINDRVSTYSHGMRQRLALAQALLPMPEILVLDEPNDGLDPAGIQEMRLLLLKLNQQHALTLLFSSHILGEVEQLCKRIAILDHGRQTFCGDWQQTVSESRKVRLGFHHPAAAMEVLARFHAQAESDSIYSIPADVDFATLITALATCGAGLVEATELRPSLETFYLQKTHT